MKVKPYIKQKPLRSNELRLITVDENAIAELLRENLMENKSKYFDIPTISNNSICIVQWEIKTNSLTYAVMPIEYCLKGYELNPDFIKNVGITTDSLFKPHRYKSFILTDEMLIKQKPGQEDGLREP